MSILQLSQGFCSFFILLSFFTFHLSPIVLFTLCITLIYNCGLFFEQY
uniref:Uncharacterized protein n=1 Tax=Rhizophora mucronata TaxID=61149 RepID=A0A2P2R0N0_RHIMU